MGREGKWHLGSDIETDFEDKCNDTCLPIFSVHPSPSVSLGADMCIAVSKLLLTIIDFLGKGRSAALLNN